MLKEKWVVGNWKMNGTAEFTQTFIKDLMKLSVPSNVQIGIAAPNLYLADASRQLKSSSIFVGAQDVSRFTPEGAYTGEVSALMLKDIGTNFTLIGHSERRQYFSEQNLQLTQKLQNAYQAQVQPIFCVGEDLPTREDKQEKKIVEEQLSAIMPLVDENLPIIVAYEPVWAIGTGKIATPEQIQEMHEHIYALLLSKGANTANMRVLYGGSVNADNASTIFSLAKVDGGLIGGASLKLETFTQIIKVTEN